MVVRLASCDAVPSTTEILELWFPVPLTFARGEYELTEAIREIATSGKRVKALELAR